MNFVLKILPCQEESSIIQALGEGEKKHNTKLDSHSQTFSPSQHTTQASRSEKGQPHCLGTNDQWFSKILCVGCDRC